MDKSIFSGAGPENMHNLYQGVSPLDNPRLNYYLAVKHRIPIFGCGLFLRGSEQFSDGTGRQVSKPGAPDQPEYPPDGVDYRKDSVCPQDKRFISVHFFQHATPPEVI